MASIGDNTRALQEILTAVQNLPEGGGSSNFESGEWVVPSDLIGTARQTICTLKAYPRVFLLLGENNFSTSTILSSVMYPHNWYNGEMTANAQMCKITTYITSTGSTTSMMSNVRIDSGSVAGRLSVTSAFDVQFTTSSSYAIRAGTYKWYAIY